MIEQVRSRLLSSVHSRSMTAAQKQTAPRADAGERSRDSPASAFAAETTDAGPMVVRLVKDTAAVWPHEEYGRFETWTQAQDFANLLNQRNGIDAVEARYIVVSARLAAQSRDEEF
jgi:hypothetical protein